jgi:hypothetical protein
MFVDIRDFTPFAESNTAQDTVARLNALFDIVVPAVVDAGGPPQQVPRSTARLRCSGPRTTSSIMPMPP